MTNNSESLLLKLRVLRRALEFYAAESSYDEEGVCGTFHLELDPTTTGGPETVTDPDRGEVAETALQEVFGKDRPPLEEDERCKYIVAWRGACGKPVSMSMTSAGLCDEHKHLKCDTPYCNEAATNECPQTMGPAICGAPLCDKCEHWEKEPMSLSAHVRKK